MTAERLVILGASGDLTGRYLLPALGQLTEAQLLPEGLDIVGVARDEWDDSAFGRHAAERLEEHAPELAPDARDRLVGQLRYCQGDATDLETLRSAVGDTDGPVLVYLAVPPDLFASVISNLAEAGLTAQDRIVVEKPFGTDLASARELNALLHDELAEDTVFRIDHFLGMQTVQNVLGLRFANRIFEPLWCAEHIEAVDIVWEETVALEGRAGYYDRAGALRDMVQNHLLQLLTFVAMERPQGLSEGSLRDAKLDVLRAVAPLDDDAVRERTVRGRYRAGEVDGHSVPDYTDEPGVDASRGTETFAEVVLTVDNDRWRGVPFRLRTGKALARDRREIRIRLRPVDHLPFGQSADPSPNLITLGMDPDRLTAEIALNGAGDPFCLEPALIALDLSPQELSAYARLLLDALDGELALAIRGDEAEEAWRIVEPVIDAWDRDVAPIVDYEAGGTGPTR